LGLISSPAKDGSETRKGKRSHVLFKATIRWRGGEGEARIRDLSRLGALVEMDRPPTLHTGVLFVRGSISVGARIAWIAGQRAGLQFDSPIDEKKLLAQRHSVPPNAPRGHFVPSDGNYRRPGIQFVKMTDEERRVARMWAERMGLSFEE
jgi:PilZ domain